MSESKTETVETVSTLTPYEVHLVVNEKLKSEGVLGSNGEVKTIPPQMIYNYVRKGVIKTTDGRKSGSGLLINISEVRVWYKKYSENLKNRSDRAGRELPKL